MIKKIVPKIADCSVNKLIAAGTVLCVFLLAITPLCGFIFGCGCTWPWLGLDAACNIHASGVARRCPWCASPTAGALSLGFSALGGAAVSLWPLPCIPSIRIWELMVRIAAGLAAFIAFALMAGFFSALAQGYTWGVFCCYV